MAGSVERIERDLAVLEEAIAEIAKEFYSSYSSYLAALGQALRQQLILATYHLCTQGYPNQFLHMSFSQRQQLQQSLRRLAEQTKETLLAQLRSPNQSVVLSTLTHDSNNGNAEELAPPTAPEETPIKDPKALVMWQEELEAAIAKILQGISRDSNRLLQQAGILSKKLPEPVLEAAAKVEATAEGIAGPPNLLNLVIEAESDAELQSSTVTHIIAIHLRLSEIEFADPTTISLRHQIRSLSARLNTIERDYQKKQRERAIAEAEAAWRASWFDD